MIDISPCIRRRNGETLRFVIITSDTSARYLFGIYQFTQLQLPFWSLNKSPALLSLIETVRNLFAIPQTILERRGEGGGGAGMCEKRGDPIHPEHFASRTSSVATFPRQVIAEEEVAFTKGRSGRPFDVEMLYRTPWNEIWGEEGRKEKKCIFAVSLSFRAAPCARENGDKRRRGRLIPLIGTRTRFASEVTGGAYTLIRAAFRTARKKLCAAVLPPSPPPAPLSAS